PLPLSTEAGSAHSLAHSRMRSGEAFRFGFDKGLKSRTGPRWRGKDEVVHVDGSGGVLFDAASGSFALVPLAPRSFVNEAPPLRHHH
ncbi:MAG: hypothetical protein AAFO91_07250, partial [Bacteroidota bacterium]